MLTLALLLSTAQAADDGAVGITSGEFRNTAQTLEAGSIEIHPFLKSTFGITDRVDVKAPILGWIGGPRGSVEINLLDSDGLAVSIEPEFAMNWNVKSYSAGGVVHLTVPVGENRFNLSGGATAGHWYIADTDFTTDGNQPSEGGGVTVPVNVGFDLVPSEKFVVRFVGTTNAALFADGVFAGALGANVNFAAGPMRVALGAAAVGGGLASYDLPTDTDLPNALVIPVPTLEVWGRF